MASPARELSSINFEAMLGGPLVAVVNAQAQAAMSSVNFIKSVGFKPVFDSNGDVLPGAVGDPVTVTFTYPKEVAPFQPAVTAELAGIRVTAGGSGYDPTTPPAVTISGGGGSGATATAVIVGGAVTDINLDNPGTGYSSAPSVVIVAPSSGTTATAAPIYRPARDAVPAQFADMRLEVPILTMLPIPFIRIEETTIDFHAKINSIVESKTDTSFKVNSTLEVAGRYPPLFSAVTAKLSVSASYQKNTSSGQKVDRTYSMAVHIRATQDEMPAGTDRVLGILEDAIISQPVG
jgi:hypothetical protein